MTYCLTPLASFDRADFRTVKTTIDSFAELLETQLIQGPQLPTRGEVIGSPSLVPQGKTTEEFKFPLDKLYLWLFCDRVDVFGHG